MPVRRCHDPRDFDDVFVGNVLVEKVAHRIHEDHPGRSPTERIAELFGHDAQIKAELKWMVRNSAPALGERFCVTVKTARADFRAAANWIHVASVHSILDCSDIDPVIGEPNS